MSSVGAKSGQFHYYTCQTYIKKGRNHCDQKLIRANKLEPFVVDLIKTKVLTEENIKNLIMLVNDELRAFEKEYTTSTALIDKTLEEKMQRRKKLYHSIETGKLDLSDIAPRIKELNDEIEQLTDEKKKLEEKYEREQI